jgi:hypothetical protein
VVVKTRVPCRVTELLRSSDDTPYRVLEARDGLMVPLRGRSHHDRKEIRWQVSTRGPGPHPHHPQMIMSVGTSGFKPRLRSFCGWLLTSFLLTGTAGDSDPKSATILSTAPSVVPATGGAFLAVKLADRLPAPVSIAVLQR